MILLNSLSTDNNAQCGAPGQLSLPISSQSNCCLPCWFFTTHTHQQHGQQNTRITLIWWFVDSVLFFLSTSDDDEEDETVKSVFDDTGFCEARLPLPGINEDQIEGVCNREQIQWVKSCDDTSLAVKSNEGLLDSCSVATGLLLWYWDNCRSSECCNRVISITNSSCHWLIGCSGATNKVRMVSINVSKFNGYQIFNLHLTAC